MYRIYLLLSYVLIQITNGMEICDQISSFDAICRNGSFIYIISANPCVEQTDISLTIVDTMQERVSSRHLSPGITNITTDHENGKGLVLVVHFKPVSSMKEYRNARLHAMLYVGDIKSYEQNSTGLQLLLQTEFAVFSDACSKKARRGTTWGHLGMKACDTSIRAGEFSTMCFVKKNNKIPAGVYLTSFDPCTVPYSTVITAFLQSGVSYKERFTQDKTDSRVMLSASNDGCGLTMTMHRHLSLEYHVELIYSCLSKDVKDMKLIDAMYHTEMGMICPLSKCKADSNNQLVHSCHSPWISGPHEQTNISHFTTTLNLCKKHVEVTMQLFVKGLHFTEKKTLVAANEGPSVLLQLETHFEDEYCAFNNNGYLCLDGGNISLYIQENKTVGLVHITILRHYPNLSNVIPLLHTEYWVRRKNVCSHQSKSKSKVVIGVAVTTVLVLLLLCVIVLCWWKKRKSIRKSKKPGLPYEIHLGEQELDNIDY